MYIVKWKGKAFGERLLTSLLVYILNDNCIDAVLGHPYYPYNCICDCPIYKEGTLKEWWWIRLTSNKKRFEFDSIISYMVHLFEHRVDKTGISIDTSINHIPVVYYDIPYIKGYDVSICSQSGKWTEYRDWPYFDELKELFRKYKISFFDVSENYIRNVELLNYVNKSKLYLGLETGTSHYVSQVANGKALIIQSGYTDFDFWAGMYDYDHIDYLVDCSPCYINTIDKKECENNHTCMKNISAEQVFERVLGML
jgi:hypothetical protein